MTAKAGALVCEVRMPLGRVVEALHSAKLVVSNAEMNREVVQRHRPTWVTWWEKRKCLSVDDGPVELLHSPDPVIPSAEIKREAVQRHRPIRMPW